VTFELPGEVKAEKKSYQEMTPLTSAVTSISDSHGITITGFM